MKILAVASAILLAAVLVLGKLYVGKAEEAAVARDANEGLAGAYEQLNARYMADQARIAERDRRRAQIEQDNRRLRRELDERLREDPQARVWSGTAVPDPVRRFVRDAQDRAAAASAGTDGAATADTDTDR